MAFDFRKCKSFKISFFFFSILGFLRITAEVNPTTYKDQRGKEKKRKRTYMCERRVQACTSTSPCYEKLI